MVAQERSSSLYYQTLKDQLVTRVPYDPHLLSLLFNEFHANRWKKFCDLPLEIKNRFKYPDHQIVGARKQDPGYVLKMEEGKEKDNKETFHYFPENRQFLEYYSLNKLVDSTPVIRNFFSFAEGVYHYSSGIALNILASMAAERQDLAPILLNPHNRFVLRFLHYLGTGEGDILAKQHYDRGGLTVHIHENQPGFEFLSLNRDSSMEWKPVNLQDGFTFAFGSYQMQELTGCEICRVWHRVRRVPGNDIANRTSIVLFVHLIDAPSYPDTHRSQDDVPGYVVDGFFRKYEEVPAGTG
jgi:isopenicillin N synthase-like dioxygenase